MKQILLNLCILGALEAMRGEGGSPDDCPGENKSFNSESSEYEMKTKVSALWIGWTAYSKYHRKCYSELPLSPLTSAMFENDG